MPHSKNASRGNITLRAQRGLPMLDFAGFGRKPGRRHLLENLEDCHRCARTLLFA